MPYQPCVLKFELDRMQVQTVCLPKGAKILSAQVQYARFTENIYLFILCEYKAESYSSEDSEKVRIAILETGECLSEVNKHLNSFITKENYITTVQLSGYKTSHHIFNITSSL